MDHSLAPSTEYSRSNGYNQRSPSPIGRGYPRHRERYNRSRSRDRSRSRSRSRDRRRRSRTPERRYRRYSRSPRRYSRRSPPPPTYARPRREVIKGDEQDRATTRSIFVGNMPYSFEERDVANMFERFGKVTSISLPIDRYTRRNKGFAFIEFEQRSDAEDAFNKYNGYEIEGRKLRLDWDIGINAKDRYRGRSPRRNRSPSPSQGRGRDYRSPPPPHGGEKRRRSSEDVAPDHPEYR